LPFVTPFLAASWIGPRDGSRTNCCSPVGHAKFCLVNLKRLPSAVLATCAAISFFVMRFEKRLLPMKQTLRLPPFGVGTMIA